VPDKKFDLGDYVEVKDRIRIFYELYANGRLVTDYVRFPNPDDDRPRITVRALAYRNPEDTHPAVGYSWMELPGTTSYTKGSELENTETSAWGRAIAALGILIDKSIASGQEVQNKQGESSRQPTGAAARGTTHEDGLVGKAVIQGTQDGMLRESPEGWTLPFRIKEGRLSQIVLAHDDIAKALDTLRADWLDKRITVWGTYSDETFAKGDDVIGYKVLHVERIQTPEWILPATEDATANLSGSHQDVQEPVEAESVPLFELDPEERLLVGGGLE
jgi:hypothetical protein